MGTFSITTAERAALTAALKVAAIPGILGLPDTTDMDAIAKALVGGVPAVDVDAVALESAIIAAVSASGATDLAGLDATALAAAIQLAVPGMNNQILVPAVAGTLDGLAKAIADADVKAQEIAEAIAVPVTAAVESWMQRLLAGLQVPGVPVSATGELDVGDLSVDVDLATGTLAVEFDS
jgi:hypothetical protein